MCSHSDSPRVEPTQQYKCAVFLYTLQLFSAFACNNTVNSTACPFLLSFSPQILLTT